MRLPAIAICLLLGLVLAGAGLPAPAFAVVQRCPATVPGSAVPEPEDLRSRDGVLRLDLSIRAAPQGDGSVRYCYLLPDGTQSPTLRLHPGDLLVLTLHNHLGEDLPGPGPGASATDVAPGHQGHGARHGDGSDLSCAGGAMTATSTNLHFHGLTVPPRCHQDDVLRTTIQASDPPFEYRFRIPADEPPGLYWYHPHVHGFSARQVLGGASGALIIEGIERAMPDVAGLPERVLVIRDQDLLHPDAPVPAGGPAVHIAIDHDGDAANTGTGGGRPAKDLSVNFVPVPYPDYVPATLAMRPGERQLWRVLNATSVTYLNLALLYQRGHKTREQWFGVVAIDGVPLHAGAGPGQGTQWRNSIVVPPGARVEFIAIAPPAGESAVLVTRSVDTGQGGENDPNRVLVSVTPQAGAPEPRSLLPAAPVPLPAPVRPWIGTVAPVRVRRLYFSEDPPDPRHPEAPTKFYLTVEGQTPAAYDPAATEPNIVVRQGEVEDWIIENRSPELHDFHIHQIHFQLVDWMGFAVNEPFVRDTVSVPYHDPSMAKYPSVRLRMDFRDPDTVGTFVYHCHLLDHEDAGMMGVIRVEPVASSVASPVARRPAASGAALATTHGVQSPAAARSDLCSARTAALLGR